MKVTPTHTSGAADLLDLIEAYAEARHRQGHSSYNAQTATALQAVKDALAAGQVTAAPENIRGILARCRDFIDTTKAPAYPAGVDLADEIDALLAAQPAPQPSHAAQAVVQDDLITIRKPTTSAEMLWLLKLAHLVISDVDKTLEETFAPAQPAAQQGAAYAATPTSNYAGRVYEEGFLIGTCPLYTADQMRAFADATYALRAAHGQAPADAAPSAGAVAGPDDIDAIALTRYKVVHSHDSMIHRFAVVAGDGNQQLYLGREVECENMARKFAGAFLDGAFYQANITPSTQAAGSVPAVEREQERIAFKDAHRHLELYEVPDAWGRPMFKHSHVEASWLGWIASASHGQAPAAPKGDIDE
ncbi:MULTISPECIES: hypothetical protein [unclassified Acidovorax]|uniref:hypothetical protein n=1 Tax=unclassified Acidovorax TaxID=2684926 RepID=UPI0018E03DA0|nr:MULTISPECIES: hypothetical protein [unclassified Acidovorax]